MDRTINPLSEADRLAIEERIPMLQRYALSLARDKTLADDVVQTTLERAIRKHHLFKSGTNLSGWLATILHNEFINTIRRRSRRGDPVPIEDWQEAVSSNPGQDHALEFNDLNDAFASLSESDREVLVLIGIEGRSYQFVADKLGVALGTVKSRLHRARAKLRKSLNGPSQENSERIASPIKSGPGWG